MHLLFGFSGRIGRGQWWLAQLAMLLVCLASTVALVALVDPAQIKAIAQAPRGDKLNGLPGSALLLLLAVAVLITWINIAATVKRFHDRDKPAVWFLIMFVPYVGSIWLLVECGMLRGTDGSNSYGPPGGTGADEGALGRQPASRVPASREAPLSAPPTSARVPSVGRANTSGFGRRGL